MLETTPDLSDFTGDGITDVLWHHKDEVLVKMWVGKGDGTYTQIDPFPCHPSWMPSCPWAGYPGGSIGDEYHYGDFNGDGRPDIFAISVDDHGRLEGGGVVYLSVGNGTFSPAQGTLNVINGPQKYKPYVADFNGDGRADIFWEPKDSDGRADGAYQRYVWFGNGNGTFQTPKLVTFSTGVYDEYGLHVSDFNNDGYADLFLDPIDIYGLSN